MVDQAKQAQANAEQKLKHSNQTVNKKLCRAIPAVTSINNVCDGRGSTVARASVTSGGRGRRSKSLSLILLVFHKKNTRSFV